MTQDAAVQISTHMTDSGPVRRPLGVLKILVTVTLLAAVIYKVGWHELYSAAASINIGWLVLALSALVAQVMFASLRWLLLTSGAGMPGGARNAVLIYLVSCLANVMFVTSVAGASLKAVLHYRLGTCVTAIAFSSIIEKLLGLLAMALACAVLVFLPENQAFVASASDYLGEQARSVAARSLVLYGLGVIGGAAFAWFALRRVIARIWQWTASLKMQTETLRRISRKLSTASMASALVATSLVTFLLGAGAVLLTANAFSQPLPAGVFLFLYPAIAIVSALPISVGGWGVREGAMIVVLGFLGVTPQSALAISITYGLAGMAVAGMAGALGSALLLSDWKTFFGAKVLPSKSL